MADEHQIHFCFLSFISQSSGSVPWDRNKKEGRCHFCCRGDIVCKKSWGNQLEKPNVLIRVWGFYQFKSQTNIWNLYTSKHIIGKI